MSPVKSQMGSRSFTRALALALNEWLLMLLLFVNSVFSYMITKYADYSELQSPCLMCSRLDHIFGKKIQLKKSYWDMICSKHKSEISSLVYCQNAESKTDSRYCSCCNQLWIPKPEMLLKIGNVRTGKQSTVKKSVSFNHLPHVGYTELKIHSDTKSEAVFSEDEVHKFRTVDLETPPVITLPYDLATDKLLNLGLPLVTQNDQEELHLKDIGLREEEDNLFLTSRAMEHFAAVSMQKEELIHLQDSSLPSDFKENPANASSMVETELISFNDVTSTSDDPETHEAISKGIDLMSLHDISLEEVPKSLTITETTVEKSKENPADSSIVEDTELISFKDVTSTSDATETHEDVSKGIDLMSLYDISQDEVPKSLTITETTVEKSKENPADSSLMETELISLNDDTSTAETHEAVSKGIDLMSLHDISQEEVPKSLTITETTVEKSKENPADFSLMETELISFTDVSSTSNASETHEDVSKGIDLMSLHDIYQEELPKSLTTIETTVEKSKENRAESEIISFNDVTSTSDATENYEDNSKGIALMSNHDISLDDVTESLTTIETTVEKSKENHADSSILEEPEHISFNDVTSTSETHEGIVDIACLESEYIFVSSSKSTTSTPENSTKNCVAESNQLAPSALESDSSSFNSMSVAAETNQYSGELLELADAYNIISHNESNGGAEIEQWMKKDTSRVSEDLKALLTQISASPRDISPKISDQETKNLDHNMQLLLQKLERNESNLSLEGVSVSEIEGESESDRLRRQVDHDRRLLTGLYKELEEERSASAIATNQAMAMITRLQEEKAMFQMEALQNLRMMEEQSEYDMEAIQKLNDLLVEREKVIQDLEAEIEYFRDQTP